MVLRRVLFTLILLTTACDALGSPTETPTLTPTETVIPTATPTATSTLTETAIPTETTIPTATETATATLTPTDLPTATNTAIPTPTGIATSAVAYDNLELVELPAVITEGINSPLIVFVNSNDSETITNLATAQPSTNAETLYFASPTNPSARYEIIRLNASTGNQIFISPRGNALAYFLEGNTSNITGLYIMDLSNIGITQRILAVPSLVKRGIYSEPAWSPDGTRIAVTREDGYELDIYSYEVATSVWQNLTDADSNEIFPVWSPDGRYLAFVSDRETCPSWIPNAENGCTDGVDIFNGGQVYTLDTSTGTITRASDAWTNEPPRWINTRQLVIAGSDPLGNILQTERTLYIADIASGNTQVLTTSGETGTPLYISDSWSDSGGSVVFQRASGSTNQILVTSSSGELITEITDYTFSRFGLSADWSPDGTRLAIGGAGGQCPFGIVVYDAQNFSTVARGNPPPSMCNPEFSPNGQFIAFDGINPRLGDGRVDVYTTNANGFGAVNLTADLRGQTRFVGWVSP
ncbi:MAG: hypothetical protein RLP44_25850 [Aggregatilineales bacterium]